MLDLILPDIAMVESQGNTATFEIGPMLAGIARDFGNALRRVLLASMPGAAITSLRIDGVKHEFQDIPNIKEDVTDIVQSLKKVRLRSFSSHDVPIYIDKWGPCMVTAADIKTRNTVEIVNPYLHIATLDNKNAHLVMEMSVSTGRGFVAAKKIEGESQPIGIILIDAIFSPIRHVGYTIRHMRVGRVTNLDEIVLSITTDGTISPTEALRQGAEILQQQFMRFEEDWGSPPDKQRKPLVSDVPIPTAIYKKPIEDLSLSVRAYNAMKRAGLTTIGPILEMDESELKLLRNVGERTLQEIADCLKKMRVFLKE